MITSLTLLALAIACRSMAELSLHGKLKWSNDDSGFWGERSYYRKYANPLDAPKDNWYYRTFKIGYRERWFTSATFTVAFTDGYHLCQFFYNIFLSLSVALLIDISYFIWIWISVVSLHALVYRIAQK